MRAFQAKRANQAAIRVFYMSVAALFVSLALGYGSIFLLVYVTVIGLPLVYWSYDIERKVLADFTAYMEKQSTADTKQRDYAKLWAKYTEKKVKKSRKK
jgi:heme O synthase-like polyprenyltransferase